MSANFYAIKTEGNSSNIDKVYIKNVDSLIIVEDSYSSLIISIRFGINFWEIYFWTSSWFYDKMFKSSNNSNLFFWVQFFE